MATVREFLIRCLDMGISYPRLETEIGINRYYLWHIVNDEKYQPPGWLRNALHMKQYKDLWAMPVDELRWALENRVVW